MHLKPLNMSLEYLRKSEFKDSQYELSKHYYFHAENFLLRLTSVVDRCHLLSGTTLLLDKIKMERMGGNRYVKENMNNNYPLSAEILTKLNNSVIELRASRNKVAHQEGYSNKNLIILQAIEGDSGSYSSEITKVMSIDSIKEMVREDITCNFKPILPIMHNLVSDLINSFASIYSSLVKIDNKKYNLNPIKI
jgi:hypothetical protein